MKLYEIDLNTVGKIKQLYAKGLLKERLLSLGFIVNNIVSPIRKKKQLTIYEVCHCLIALRDDEAGLIEVDLFE